jgi:hypothetical protein
MGAPAEMARGQFFPNLSPVTNDRRLNPRLFVLLLVLPGNSGLLLSPLQAQPFRRQEKTEIRFWYGDEQHFGRAGRAQRWVNVLGTVSQPEQIRQLQYRIGGSRLQDLTMGGDLHRLAREGDFNVELAWEDLKTGENRLQVIALMRNGSIITAECRLILHPPAAWPLPLWLDFTQADTGLEQVQVVDGRWVKTEAGLRTAEPYYDRVIAVGDSSWRDYEATARITVHGFTPSSEGPPTYGVTHMGMALRWRGHSRDGLQPSRQWYPLGAQGEFLLDHSPEGARWRILFDGRPEGPSPVYSERINRYEPGRPMYLKGQVSTLDDGRSRYRFRQWMEGEPEPPDWDVEGYESGENDHSSGALCLVPHHPDVTVHFLMVEPLQKTASRSYARPGPGSIHRSAPVGGLFGAQGNDFDEDFLCSGCRLLAVQVNADRVVRGLRFRYAESSGVERELTIGNRQGAWQDWHPVPEGSVLTGISGASGWYIDRLRLHFSDGSHTPEYGGTGGDTEFSLSLRGFEPGSPSRIRGLYGSFDGTGIGQMGLIFDPAE